MLLTISPLNNKSHVSFTENINKTSLLNYQYIFNDTFKKNDIQQTNNSINIQKIKDLNIAHFRLIDSNSVRGVTLAKQPISILYELKDAGIDTYIDLRHTGGDDTKLAAKCNEAGIDYFNLKLRKNIPVFNNIQGTKYSTKEFAEYVDNFSNHLKNFFELMDKKKLYMSCELGLHRTDIAVSMHYLFNRQEPVSPPLLSHMYFKEENNHTNEYIGYIKNLYRNLKTYNKAEMLHLPESSIFASRIAKLQIMNRVK